MVEFSVRIDFYRDLEGPKDYVGSALRDGLSAVVLPRVGEHVLGLGPDAWRKGPYGEPYSVVQAVEHRATPAWKLDPTTPEKEEEAVVAMLGGVPANRPAPGTLLVGDKGFAGRAFQTALAGLELGILRPARTDEPDPGVFPNWLRQRIEAIIWTLKHQLGLDRHGGRIPAGLWARVVQRLLALNTAIWFNWQIGAPTKRSLIAYDH
jgi:hypothetical protein